MCRGDRMRSSYLSDGAEQRANEEDDQCGDQNEFAAKDIRQPSVDGLERLGGQSKCCQKSTRLTVDVNRYAVPTHGAISARLNTRPSVGKAVVTLLSADT